MSSFARWWRFNLVGVAGMAVQLTVLAAMSRAWPAHYLAETLTALEVTLLHNFLWHERFTWRDRGRTQRAARLMRFHLTNGAVSLAASLLIVPLLVEGARLPVVAANTASILVCSLVNFALGDRWVFAPISPRRLIS